MNQNMREIRCTEMAEIEREFPMEISVVREMLTEAEERCRDEPAS